MSSRLAGRGAIVTGAGSGIGRAAALRFAREGARVCCADLDGAAAHATAKEIETRGGEAFGFEADVAEPEPNSEMVDATCRRYGALRVALLNAGIGLPSTVLGGSVEEWDRVIAVDLRGSFLGMRATAPALIEAGGGAIIATASTSALGGQRGLASYCAAKHGVLGLVKSAALELAPSGVRVNAVCPGIVDTPILGPLHGNQALLEGPLARAHPLNRVGRPEEVAGVCAFLASDEAAFVTGSAYLIDGGASAMVGADLTRLAGD